jgi:hypothetical protein
MMSFRAVLAPLAATCVLACSRASQAAPPALPADLQELTFEGREGASLADICGAWRRDLVAVVAKMQEAGLGLDGYDLSEPRCEAAAAPRLEGTLPPGWSVVSAAGLHWFDGVALEDQRFVVLRRPDGKTIAGPMYSTASDVGDSPRPSAWRLAVARTKKGPVLLVASAAAWHSPYDPGADPDALEARYEARVCRFEAARVACDQREPTLFAKKTVKAAPIAELPPIDPATGALKISTAAP